MASNVFSPLLFNIYLENVERKANIESHVFKNRGSRLMWAFTDNTNVYGKDMVFKINEN